MPANAATPCSVLFTSLKKHGGISYKELAGLILSGKPLSDGKSPVSRINDRTWISRLIVHAPAGSLQEKYFCDFGIGALRVVSRLKSKEGRGLASQQILDLVCGPDGEAMATALANARQNASLYRNFISRMKASDDLTVDELAEVAMVFYVAAGCTADVARAISVATDFIQVAHGVRFCTPPSNPSAVNVGASDALPPASVSLQLLRIVDGYSCGEPHWVSTGLNGSVIGALATGEDDITNVGEDVSARHARAFCDEQGGWYIEGLGSRNGTRVRDGATHALTVVEPPRMEANGCKTSPVRIHPGDEILLGESTVFLVLEGIRG